MIDYNGTTLEGAQANVKETADFQCLFRNADLIQRYKTQFEAWCSGVIARPTMPPPKPEPLHGFVVKFDEAGWAFVATGPEPVCAPLPVPEAVANALNPPAANPNMIDLGPCLGGNWYACGPKDQQKVGATVETPLGKFVLVGAPVGKGWYLKIG